MAAYRFDINTKRRSEGSNAVAAAAYRSGERLQDIDGTVKYPHRSKDDVRFKNIIGWTGSRGELWREVELAETRCNSTVAREIQVSIPYELRERKGWELLDQFAEYIHKETGSVVDIAGHKRPAEKLKESVHECDDPRKLANAHGHLLFTPRAWNGEKWGKKEGVLRELGQKNKSGVILKRWRKKWEDMCNAFLAGAGVSSRVSCAKTEAPAKRLLPSEVNKLKRPWSGIEDNAPRAANTSKTTKLQKAPEAQEEEVKSLSVAELCKDTSTQEQQKAIVKSKRKRKKEREQDKDSQELQDMI
jgi:bifunctional DNA-binding transcriptional regulator/antitoxin component of YhaV-PrlF toxin-antitoxin module